MTGLDLICFLFYYNICLSFDKFFNSHTHIVLGYLSRNQIFSKMPILTLTTLTLVCTEVWLSDNVRSKCCQQYLQVTEQKRHSMPPDVYQGLTFRQLSRIYYQFQNASAWAVVRFMGYLL